VNIRDKLLCVKPHLRDGRTDRRREYNSRRMSVRPFVTSRSDVETRRRSRWTLLSCVFVRPSVSQMEFDTMALRKGGGPQNVSAIGRQFIWLLLSSLFVVIVSG